MDNQPVYKLYFMKQTVAAITASPEMRAESMKKHDEFLAQTGGKVLLVCDMVWSNEEYEYFGLEVFPNLQALIKYHDCLRSIGWFAYFESKSYLGWTFNEKGEPSEPTFPAPPAPGETPIYKLALWSLDPRSDEEPEKVQELVKGQGETMNKVGEVDVFSAYTRMNNEAHFGFLIERYPNLEAVYMHYKDLEFTGWYKYIKEVHSCLGKAISGSLSGLDG